MCCTERREKNYHCYHCYYSLDLGFQISRDETKSRETRPHNSTVSGRACAYPMTRPVSAGGRSSQVTVSSSVGGPGRAEAGPALDHLCRFFPIAVVVAWTTLSLDEKQNGGQQSDDDAS